MAGDEIHKSYFIMRFVCLTVAKYKKLSKDWGEL